MKKNKLIILDNGHGGYKDGVYVTAPSKMHVFEDGFTVHEGYFNREVVKKIAFKLASLGIPFINLVPGPEDMPLKDRVVKANELTDQWKGEAIYISVHSNGGKGTGFEVYTSKGQTKSDEIAEFYLEAMAEEFPDKAERRDDSDGDGDKEANFYVLKNTKCPAVLTESFFMDRREDAELMMSYEGMRKIVNAHVKMIERALSGRKEIPVIIPNPDDIRKEKNRKRREAEAKKKSLSSGKK
tara:strand:- start:875 stop:1594 length:720 start_codon:yes stop_codon:yes gene_type:complete